METGDVDVINKINVEAGWECTSCQACSEVCPVGNQVEKSDEVRNIQVLVEGNVPQEYQKLFMNLQNTGNTEGATSSEISTKLPIYDGTQEYVIWLGCFANASCLVGTLPPFRCQGAAAVPVASCTGWRRISSMIGKHDCIVLA